MKRKFLVILFSFLFIFASGQNKKIYFTDPGELIFQFTQTNIEDNTAENGVRTSYFTNVPYYMNINCSNHFGFMPGISIKNIGIKTKNERIDSITYDRIKRRVFTSGLSMAVKCGFFDKGIWAFAGAGIDWAFHYRQKLFETSGRKNVIKNGEWMSNATPTYIPSLFFGIQTPLSFNIKATYYFNDFLNKNYKGSLGDFSKFTQSQLFTISFSVILKEMPDKYSSEIQLEQPSKREKTIEL
ncbi:MAG: hypothetical protein MJ198_01235 [Bacteroidales bacterium]|nr:hypothetical protein [Bacteroidales bacterium]